MTKEEAYQRVPLLPLSQTNLSAQSLVKGCGAEAEDGPQRSARGRTGALIGSALVVVLLWAASVRLSWVWAQESAIVEAIKLVNSSDGLTSLASGAELNSSSAPPPASSATTLFDIEGPANFSALAQVCNQTDWASNRWFSCDRMEGGIGNIRDETLTCVRYAVAAGASLVMPSLRLRGDVAFGEEDLHTGGRAGLEFYFDVDYFKETMGQYCPQMAIADSIYQVPSFGIATMPDVINFKDIYTLATGEENGADLPWPAFLNPNAATFRSDFDEVYPPDPTSDVPTIHRFELAYFQWEIKNDPVPFWHNFGRLLNFRADVTELAAEVHANLVGPNNTAYFGAHLRLEADVNFQWGSAREQFAVYTQRLLSRPLDLVYVACGVDSAAQQYQRYLATRSRPDIRVRAKQDLLSPASLERLKAMPFDQQAQVDYLVLLKSAFHAGSGASSFTANLAARRHLLTSRRDEPFLWYEEDELTYLFRGDSASFMRQAMWP